MNLAQLGRDLAAQKLRTALTILGITWGTVAVVVLLAFGNGFEKQTRKNMHGMGNGVVVVFGGTTTKPFQGFPDGRDVRLRLEDAEMLRQQVRGIDIVSPEYRAYNITARVDSSNTNPAVTGAWPVYAEMRNIIVEPGGRFLNDLDETQRRRVVVLGDAVKRLLFGPRPALHERVLLDGVPFTVIGVMQEKTQNSSYGSRDADRVFIPASTFRAVFGGVYLSNIVYRPASAALAGAVERNVYEAMGRRYTFDPSDDDALGVWDTNRMNQMLDGLFLGINLFLGIVGAFTLVVGGIGVANIMYVVVRERTREIGIKRSIGARRSSILFQFLLEAALIVALGALLGFMVSVALIELVGLLPIEDAVGRPQLSPTVLLGTIALLGFVSLLAGYFPARKAARLKPVDALRYGV